MCGIVGHLGPQNSVEIVLEGLKRLEYRGYDSAGVSFVDENSELTVYKKSGKLENLKNLLGDKKFTAKSCIGHTRWATHGVVNDINAHPHNDDSIAIIHNGIIENAEELKEKLIAKGISFCSDTDSEVFLGLINFELKSGFSFLDSFIRAFKQIEGNSAFVALNRETAEILAVKKSAPLVCGIHDIDSSVMVSSDPYALVGLVNKLYFPEDEIICSLSSANQHLLSFCDLDKNPSHKYFSKKQELTLTPSEKGEYEHFMLKEIHEQPELIRALTQFYFNGDGSPSLELAGKNRPTRIHIAACGTAYYAGLAIRDIIEKRNKIPCIVELASEFRYRDPLLQEGDLALFISQSGETADTLAAQALCKAKKIKTLSIVNVENSSLYRECDENLLIRAGREICVCSTKAFTQMVLTGYLLSSSLENALDHESTIVNIVNQFSILADRIDHLLNNVEKIKKIAEKIHTRKGFFFTGRGKYYPISLEGALKLKEIAYVHAEGYAAGELKHGPIALIEESIVNIAIVGPELFAKTISNIQEIKARNGVIVVIGQEKNRDLEKVGDHYIPLNFDGLDDLSPLYVNVANQLLAYYMAKFKGTDIDKPRNLAKSVTVE